MSNLSNLYISESYYGVVNLIDATEPFVSQSAGRIYLTDGLGENLGLSLDYTKRVSIDNGLTVSGSTILSGSVDIIGNKTITGSLSVSGNITAGGTVSAGTGSFDTVNTRVLHVLVESASVILSSGSNQIGDEITDVQTIVGQTSISGSLTVIGNHSHTGNQSITGSLFVSNEISSSTINGIGNVTAFSSSVDFRINNLSSSVDTTITNLSSSLDSRLDYLEGPFSTSVDARLVSLENFSSSLVTNFVTDAELSAALETVTSSLQSQIDTKLASSWTGSVFIPFSSSVDSRINSKLNTSTFTSFSSSVATTGSNTFIGNQIFSGSVSGDVHNVLISSNTASLDCSIGNFYILTLPSGSTRIETSNIQKGKTISLKLEQSITGSGSAVFDSKVKFSSLQTFVTTTTSNAIDIVTFVSYDTGSLFAVETKNLV